jgi:hypothetical protein
VQVRFEGEGGPGADGQVQLAVLLLVGEQCLAPDGDELGDRNTDVDVGCLPDAQDTPGEDMRPGDGGGVHTEDEQDGVDVDDQKDGVDDGPTGEP